MVVGLGGVAQAGGRKRVVVLDFEGPKSEQFHEDLVKLIKKTHTVVSTEKWNGAAEELGAGTLSEKNIKKIAKKLKVDAVVEGKIDKRRDAFIIKLKLHQGKTGEMVGGPIGTKADGPRLEGKAQRDLKDELIGAIDSVESNHSGTLAEDDEDKPAKKVAKHDDEEDRPAKKQADDEEDKPRKFSKRSAERGGDKVEDEDALPPKKVARREDDEPVKKTKKRKRTDDDEAEAPRKKKKRVAARDEDESLEAEAPPLTKEEALTHAERAVDVTLGMSLTARRLSFTYRPMNMAKTPGYKGNPVGGAMVDLTLYPLAFGHKRRDLYKNIGLNVMYDRVIKIDSKDADGNVLETKSSRWAIGGVFRYPLGKGVNPPVVGGSLSYGKQLFRIKDATDIPSVNYNIYEPAAFVRLPIGKLTLGVDAGLMIINDTGQFQDQMHYGTTKLIGYEGELGADYMVTPNVFVRAAFKYETIRFKFLGNGELTINHDRDPTTVDVLTGQDNYIGGFVTAGYVY